jgi:hypothetical protein
MKERTVGAAALFEEAIAWLGEHYGEFEFWMERDLVWTVQSRLRKVIGYRGLPYEIFNDYPMLPGLRRSRSADLVIRATDRTVLVAAEFKYEPSHYRPEFLALPTSKFPIVDWGYEGVARDIARIREFVEVGGARAAFAVLVDEGRYFRHRQAHPGSEWRDWEPAGPVTYRPSVLWARWPPAELHARSTGL